MQAGNHADGTQGEPGRENDRVSDESGGSADVGFMYIETGRRGVGNYPGGPCPQIDRS